MNLISIFKKKIKTKVSQGTWMQIQSSTVANNLSLSKAEWVVLDLEHGSFSIDKIHNIISVIKKNKKLAFVRTSENSDSEIKKVLEAGADGLIFPRIEKKLNLDRMIKNSYYPPLGSRSFGFSHDNDFGKKINIKFKPFICAMIESIEGVNNLENIIKSKGLDAILIGKYDLELSFKNIKNHFFNIEKIIEYIFSIAKKNKIPYGLHIVENNKKTITKYIKMGCKFLPVCIDTVHLQNIINER